MRASLPQTLRRRRRSREGRHAHPPAPRPPSTPTSGSAATIKVADPAVRRVRDAGGPLDEAAYVCQCGLAFRAPVSTTVACPHCRAPQAW